MTSALLKRAAEAARLQADLARTVVVGTACGWAEVARTARGARHPVVDAVLLVSVRRYDRATERWERFERAHIAAVRRESASGLREEWGLA
jgi:hypothetical protein